MKRAIFLALLALTACGPERLELNPPPPPSEWLQCEPLPEAAELDALTAVTLPDGSKAYLKAETDARDGAIARYIISLRGAHFSCANALQRVREYYDAVE